MVVPLQVVAYDRDSVLGLPWNGVTDVHRDAGLLENLHTVIVVASEHDCELAHRASVTDVFDSCCARLALLVRFRLCQ